MHDLELNPDRWPLLISKSRVPAGIDTVTASYDGAPIAEVGTAGLAQVDDTLDVAYGLYRDRDGWLPLAERVATLERTAAIMSEHADLLAMEAVREGGKPLVDSRVEVTRAIDGVQICIEHIRSNAGDVIPMGTTRTGAGRLALHPEGTHRLGGRGQCIQPPTESHRAPGSRRSGRRLPCDRQARGSHDWPVSGQSSI